VITFTVYGIPVPKQSFRYTANGGGYQSQSVKDWQEQVVYALLNDRQTDALDEKQWLEGSIEMTLTFYLPTKRRVDLDNLSKGVLDALNGVLFQDDSQVTKLTLEKRTDKITPRVEICVKESETE